AYGAPPLLFRGDVIRDPFVSVRTRTGIRRAHAAAGGEQARAAEAACSLVFTNLECGVAGIDAFGNDGADAEVERAIEVVDDRLAAVVLRAVGGALLKARMRVDVDERRHHRLAGEIDPHRARRCFHIVSASDACDGAVLDDEGRL